MTVALYQTYLERTPLWSVQVAPITKKQPERQAEEVTSPCNCSDAHGEEADLHVGYQAVFLISVPSENISFCAFLTFSTNLLENFELYQL